MDEILEQKIILYYLTPKSERETVLFFNLKNRHALNKILEKYHICKHSKEIIKQLNKQNSERGCLLKYGVKNCMQNSAIAAKARQTLLNRTPEEIKEASIKAATTKFKLYGDATYNNRQKAAESNLAKYGTTTASQSIQVKEKIKQTCLATYGVENPFMAENIKEKIKNTCLSKYGNEYYTKTQDYIDKTIASCQEKYGTNYYCQSLEYAKTAHKKYTYNNLTFDSSWELALWIYAKDHNEQIERCPVKLSYTIDNIVYYCVPDFNYKGQLIEIKGSQFIDENNNFVCPYDTNLNARFIAKQKCLLANGVSILKKQNIQFALDYIKNTYGKNYLKKFKNK